MMKYTIESTKTTITVKGAKGTYSHDLTTDGSTRTKAYKHFISQVLRDYGTQAVNDIIDWENYR